MSVLPSSLLLWLDASDTATITTDATGGVSAWTSKADAGGTVYSTSTDFASNFTASAVPTGPWVALYMSRSGRTMFVIPEDQVNQNILCSSDYGNTWVAVLDTVPTRMNDIEMSSNGQYIVATGDENYLYVSNDYGATFTAMLSDATRAWEWASVSGDGAYMLASTFGDGVYRSTDSGATFTLIAGLPTNVTDMGFVFIDRTTGATQFAGYFGGPVHRSTDYGATWAAVPSLPNEAWYDLYQTGNGQMFIWSYPGNIYMSTDNGATWVNIFAGSRQWVEVKASSDSSVIAAIEKNGLFHISRDSGATWTPQIDTTPRNWTDLDVSLDGLLITAAADNLYVSQDGGGTFAVAAGPGSYISIGMSTLGSVFAYSAYNDTVHISRKTSPDLTTHDGKQYVYFEGSQMELTGVDFGTSYTMFLVYTPTMNQRNALWSFDATHAFYPRGAGGTTELSYGTTPATISDPVNLNTPQVSTIMLSPTNLKFYENTDTTYNELYTSAPGGTTFRIGNDAVNNNFNGYLGEILVYPGNLNISDWRATMAYLANKWNIAAAQPVLPGVGSDPHLMTVDGKRFDVVQPGWFKLISVGKDFSIDFKVSFMKLQRGLYIERVKIHNGPYNAQVTFKNRKLSLTKSWDSPIHFLEVDNTDSVTWNIHPVSPKRLVKVLRGYHTILGPFWIYLDFSTKYVLPFFPQMKSWEKARGLLVSPEDESTKNRIKMNHKKVNRSIVRNTPVNI
jgi:photosystem II stability/assembly factor-like uncharacterized protein